MGQVITGVFHNWAVLGKASVNSTNTIGIQVSLEGSPLVLVANYTVLKAYVNVKFVVNDPNLCVLVTFDGFGITVRGSTTIGVPAGFANLTIYTYQANDTSLKTNGIIKHYVFGNIEYNKVYNQYSVIVFIPPNPSVTPIIYLNYLNNFNFYKVYINATTQYYVCLSLNGTVYNYDQAYWIIGGNYSFNPVGIFNGSYTYGAKYVTFEYSNGTTLHYTFPNIPSYVIINQPMTISVQYGITQYWVHLS
jgi:hypothetical protein